MKVEDVMFFGKLGESLKIQRNLEKLIETGIFDEGINLGVYILNNTIMVYPLRKQKISHLKIPQECKEVSPFEKNQLCSFTFKEQKYCIYQESFEKVKIIK